MKHRFWIAFSGFVWTGVGIMLLQKGLTILGTLPDSKAATGWMAAGLFLGFIKGRFVLSKTVKRVTDRISSLPLPISFSKVYPMSYWLVLAAMMGLGFAMKFVPAQWRGCIDVAVGSALINGAMLYFRAARSFVVGRT